MRIPVLHHPTSCYPLLEALAVLFAIPAACKLLHSDGVGVGGGALGPSKLEAKFEFKQKPNWIVRVPIPVEKPTFL